MKRIVRRLMIVLGAGLGAFLLLLACAFAVAAQPAPAERPAVDGVIAAFRQRPLVGIYHHPNLAQEGQLFNAIVSHPRFAAEVGNVVIDFGNGVHQEILDRYLSGGEVPYAELRRVWTEGALPPRYVSSMYPSFFATVREVNAKLPPERRIRVWMADNIDWDRVESRQSIPGFSFGDGARAANLIERRILEQGKKALVLYGFGHLQPSRGGKGVKTSIRLWDFVEYRRPGSFFIVTPYLGHAEAGCTARFEAKMKWTGPTLAAPVRGTALERALRPYGCRFGPPDPPNVTRNLGTWLQELRSGVAGDAVLFLGPVASLSTSPPDPTAPDETYVEGLQSRLATAVAPATAADVRAAFRRPVRPVYTPIRTTPARGTEAAVKRLAAGIAKGTPPYEAMTPPIAAATGRELAALQAKLPRAEPVRKVAFLDGAVGGPDHFVLHLAGKHEVHVWVQLDAAGKLAVFTMR